MTGFVRAVWILLAKDLRLEIRSREILTSTLFFALLIVVIFGFAFQTQQVDLRTQAPGLLWVALSFSGTLALHRVVGIERENACLRGLLLAPVDRAAIFVAKVLATVVFVGLSAVAIWPMFSALLRVPIAGCLPQLALVTFGGVWGFAEVGTLLATLASGSRLREVLLPLLLYPLWIPIVVACVEVTGLILTGRPLAEATDGLYLILVYDIVFFVAGFLLFGTLVEE